MHTLTLLLPAAICGVLAIGCAFDAQTELGMLRDGVTDTRRHAIGAITRATLCAAGFVAAMAPVLGFAIRGLGR